MWRSLLPRVGFRQLHRTVVTFPPRCMAFSSATRFTQNWAPAPMWSKRLLNKRLLHVEGAPKAPDVCSPGETKAADVKSSSDCPPSLTLLSPTASWASALHKAAMVVLKTLLYITLGVAFLSCLGITLFMVDPPFNIFFSAMVLLAFLGYFFV